MALNEIKQAIRSQYHENLISQYIFSDECGSGLCSVYLINGKKYILDNKWIWKITLDYSEGPKFLPIETYTPYNETNFSELELTLNLNKMKLLQKANGNVPRSSDEKERMIKIAAIHYGEFLKSLGFDYEKDPQTRDTPKRVAKAWVNDLIVGSNSEAPSMTTFPNEESYDGLVIQSGIRVVSMCAHHNLPFTGSATIAYVPEDNVIGLSKLNRIVDFYSRRPQMQESLTQQIYWHICDALKTKHVAVSISAKHTCCGNRGIKHPESVMTTNKFGGVFMEPSNLVREEFLQAIQK